MVKHRVVVTGLGAVTPLAMMWKRHGQNIIQGKSGIGPLTRCKCR